MENSSLPRYDEWLKKNQALPQRGCFFVETATPRWTQLHYTAVRVTRLMRGSNSTEYSHFQWHEEERSIFMYFMAFCIILYKQILYNLSNACSVKMKNKRYYLQHSEISTMNTYGCFLPPFISMCVNCVCTMLSKLVPTCSFVLQPAFKNLLKQKHSSV